MHTYKMHLASRHHQDGSMSRYPILRSLPQVGRAITSLCSSLPRTTLARTESERLRPRAIKIDAIRLFENHLEQPKYCDTAVSNAVGEAAAALPSLAKL